MEVTESKKVKYAYPFGLGSFLMSGCGQMNGLASNTDSMSNVVDSGGSSEMEGTVMQRKKREAAKEESQKGPSKSESFVNFCGKYAQLEQTRECFVI
jgi:hypothetical protein